MGNSSVSTFLLRVTTTELVESGIVANDKLVVQPITCLRNHSLIILRQGPHLHIKRVSYSGDVPMLVDPSGRSASFPADTIKAGNVVGEVIELKRCQFF